MKYSVWLQQSMWKSIWRLKTRKTSKVKIAIINCRCICYESKWCCLLKTWSIAFRVPDMYRDICKTMIKATFGLHTMANQENSYYVTEVKQFSTETESDFLCNLTCRKHNSLKTGEIFTSDGPFFHVSPISLRKVDQFVLPARRFCYVVLQLVEAKMGDVLIWRVIPLL